MRWLIISLLNLMCSKITPATKEQRNTLFAKMKEAGYVWKPSDEQMKALEEACDEHWEPDGLDPLYTLWEQLKKLREE